MKTWIILTGILISTFSFAAEISGLTVNGEAAMDYNFLSSQDTPPALGGAKDNQYRFNSAQLTLKKDIEQLYIFSRLTYVPTTYTVSGTTTSTENLGVLKQFEFFYRLLPNLHIGFGRFLTTFGFESPMRNTNITYNYSIARQTLYPIYAEGIRAKYFITNEVTLTASNYNRIPDATFGDDNTSSKATEVALSGTHSKFAWYAGYITSRDEQNLEKVDNKGLSFWTSYVFDNFSLIGTYDNRSSKKESAGLYYSQSFSGTVSYRLNAFNFYARQEIVSGASDINKINGSADFKDSDKIDSLTLGTRFTAHENLYLYAEFRRDRADEKTYLTKGGNLTKDLSVITLGAIARF